MPDRDHISWTEAVTGLIRQRLTVVDPGHHLIKILTVDQTFGRIRPSALEHLSLKEEGLLSDEESLRPFQTLLTERGPQPLVLVLPQDISVSQVIDIPSSRPEEVRKAIEQETGSVSGLTESAVVFDYARLRPFGRYQNPYWVTFCRESEVQREIERLGDAAEQLYEVTTPANALLAAWHHQNHTDAPTLLVDFGAATSVIVVIHEGQGIFATSIPVGATRITEAIARERHIKEEQAEALKSSQNLFADAGSSPSMRAAVDEWHRELLQVLQSCLDDNPELGLRRPSFQLTLSGGGSLQMGLAEYLSQQHDWEVSIHANRCWERAQDDCARWALCWGAALLGFGRSRHAASLLPPGQRSDRRWRQVWLQSQAAAWAILLVLAVAMVIGIAQKFHEVRQKSLQLVEARATLTSALEIERMARELTRSYEQLRPILSAQWSTLGTLNTLQVLHKTRQNKDLWYVLFADQQSYFAGTTVPPAVTNIASPPYDLFPTPAPTNALSPIQTNGFIAELCFPQEGDAMRQNLSRLVSELKEEAIFRRVDTLSSDIRKGHVDPKLVVTNRHFAIAMDLLDNEYSAVNPVKESPTSAPPREPRRLDRVVRPRPSPSLPSGTSTKRES